MPRAVGAVFEDVNGRTRLQVIKAATDPCSILTQVQALSNAAVQYNWDGNIDPPIGTPSAAPYQPAQVYADLLFQTATGTILQVQIVAPDLSIFMADGVTVDPAQVASLTAACIGELCDLAGNVAVSYLGGALSPSSNSYAALGF